MLAKALDGHDPTGGAAGAAFGSEGAERAENAARAAAAQREAGLGAEQVSDARRARLEWVLRLLANRFKNKRNLRLLLSHFDDNGDGKLVDRSPNAPEH